MSQSFSDAELEALWDGLLSRDAQHIREAFATLLPDERPAILAHLQRMAQEDGWHVDQKRSAQAALQALAHTAAGWRGKRQ